MKTQTVKLNHLKISPRKVRLVTQSIRGLAVSEAEAQLLLRHKKAAEPIIKLLRSGIANVKNRNEMDLKSLFIKEIRVDSGPVMKRHMPRAMGRATGIKKKSSHITLVLGELESPKEPRFTIVKKEKISKSKAEKIQKENKPKDKPGEDIVAKSSPKKGFMKKVFSRKAI
ncbi:MAG: 50S ribosomal protein L22 [Candidatus Wolfebacteria bacterium]|nr:50S ribosomal protein L22 [Candidatus Wolfebacteria bacterium]